MGVEVELGGEKRTRTKRREVQPGGRAAGGILEVGSHRTGNSGGAAAEKARSIEGLVTTCGTQRTNITVPCDTYSGVN